MSNFLLVAPEGWTQLDMAVCAQIPGVSNAAIENYVSSNALATLATELINGGVLPTDSVILEAQTFNGEVLLVKLG